MSYIFLDESGDLGFDFTKKKTSRYFMVTFLFVEHKRPVAKLVKKLFSRFSKQQIRSHHGTLHAHKETPRTRQKLLSGLAEKEVSILVVYLDKQKVYTKLQDEKQVLYNYVTNILLDRIMTRKLVPTNQKITLVASRRETNKFLNENFKSYLSNQVLGNHKLKLEVDIKIPHEDKCLQIADMASWAIFRKWEHRDASYYSLIKDKIVEENPLFP
ncbi:MAG: DUF3800 domain-containing protein [Candidatus Saccharimonadales bacterium]